MTQMKHAFLFGAGASFGSGDCIPERPPLGNQLFDKLEPTLRVAGEIDEDVKKLFRKNFEAGMDELLKRKSWVLQSFQQDLARYIAQFEPGAKNHYRQLEQIMRAKRIGCLLSTLNYDILLERSLELAGIPYNHLISPPPPGHSFAVYKLHGSCNIVPNPSTQFRGLLLDVRAHEAPPGTTVGGVAGDDVKSLSRTDLYQWLDEEDTLVPCLAMYHASKLIRDHARPFNVLQEQWAQAFHGSEALFIIGVRLVLHDTHIWDPISRYKGKIYWISRDATDALAWAKSHGLDMVHFAQDFSSFIPAYDSSF